MKTFMVNIDKKKIQPYKICIGYDMLDRIALMIGNSHVANSYVIVTDSHVGPLYAEALLASLNKLGLKSNLIVFPAGERSKSIKTVLDISNKLLELYADRKSALIALGGGVVGDITGFVASIFMRGIPYFQVPTSLIAQVDSSIGGKTGIDLPQGKNLLGTFYQPADVFIDIKFLETLSEAEYKNGLAEVVKYGIIDNEVFFRKLESSLEEIRSRDKLFLEEIIHIACNIKRNIVEKDERDQGLRGVLNFGHTLGHALESASGYRISHGNAIAVGMIAATRLSNKLYGLQAEDQKRIEWLIGSMGLACSIPENLEMENILSRLQQDKKKDGKTTHFVMLKKIGMPFITDSITDKLLRETINDLIKWNPDQIVENSKLQQG